MCASLPPSAAGGYPLTLRPPYPPDAAARCLPNGYQIVRTKKQRRRLKLSRWAPPPEPPAQGDTPPRVPPWFAHVNRSKASTVFILVGKAPQSPLYMTGPIFFYYARLGPTRLRSYAASGVLRQRRRILVPRSKAFAELRSHPSDQSFARLESGLKQLKSGLLFQL